MSQKDPRRLLPSRWVMVDGQRMHYRAAGRGGSSLVLVHGLSVSGDYLLPTAAQLIDDFQVYVPDLPGFGASAKPRRVLEITEMADTLKAWMATIGLDRAYLMGNSLGCHTIAVMAARYRECVAGTIMVSPVGDPGGRNSLRLGIRAVSDFVRESPSLWAIMFRDYLKAGPRRTIRTLHSLQRSRLEGWLPQMDVPALVVWGGRDRIVPGWWIDRVAELLPKGQATIIPEAAHVANFSHPAQLAVLVRAFVNGIDETNG